LSGPLTITVSPRRPHLAAGLARPNPAWAVPLAEPRSVSQHPKLTVLAIPDAAWTKGPASDTEIALVRLNTHRPHPPRQVPAWRQRCAVRRVIDDGDEPDEVPRVGQWAIETDRDRSRQRRPEIAVLGEVAEQLGADRKASSTGEALDGRRLTARF
jgi:hypothetical protein